MKAVFVTGTDTGVGKTYFTGLLAHFLVSSGKKAITQKWIQTGTNDLLSDIDEHFKLTGQKKKAFKEDLSFISPYVFKHASSPHLAARLEKKMINPGKIKTSFKHLSKKFDFIIAEGAGGVLVPFSKNRLIIDIVKELKLPVIIVAANKLGAINHTLLTIEALHARKIKCLGVVLNNCENKKRDIIIKDNPKIIKSISKVDIFGEILWSKDKLELYRNFELIGKKVLSKLNK